MKPVLTSSLLCALLWPSFCHALSLDLPQRQGEFWLKLDALPQVPPAAAPQSSMLRFGSLAALTEHALRERPESRAAWLSIQAEAARLDAAEAANWPTLTGQFNFTQSKGLSSSGSSVPVLHRYGPSLSLSYVLYDFGARAAGIDARRYQLVASLLNNNRTLQTVITEVESGYFAWLSARALVEAQLEQEKALRASLDAVDVRLRGGLASRADQLRARRAG